HVRSGRQLLRRLRCVHFLLILLVSARSSTPMIFSSMDKGNCFCHGTRSRGLLHRSAGRTERCCIQLILITAKSKTYVHDGVYLYGGIPRKSRTTEHFTFLSTLPSYIVRTFARAAVSRSGRAIAPTCNYATADITFQAIDRPPDRAALPTCRH